MVVRHLPSDQHPALGTELTWEDAVLAELQAITRLLGLLCKEQEIEIDTEQNEIDED